MVSPAVPGSRQPPPGLVGGVAASSDTPAHVRVTWQAVSGALGYHVYRDGVKLTGGGNGVIATSYEDVGADVPAATWQAPGGLGASQDRTEHVALSWVAPTRPLGTLHTYQVSAVNAAGESELSAPASGRRAASALTSYEVASTVGGSTTYRDVGLVTSFDDAAAPLATISGGTVGASKGDHRARVALTTSGGGVGTAPSVSYQVRGVLADGTKTPLSTAQSGRRATGALSRQWQRSSGATPDGWSDLGCAAASCDDTTAPDAGTARWYRVELSAAGAQTTYIAPVEGWRLAFVSVAAGGGSAFVGQIVNLYGTTCAVTPIVPDGGRVWCWGSNFAGFLGSGATVGPTRVLAFDQVVEVVLGTRHGCARKSDGSVWCWGHNEDGQLGDGTTTMRSTPVRAGALHANHLGAQGFTSCAVLTNGQLWCWGDNASGQLGDDTTTDRPVPVRVRTSSTAYLSDGARVGVGSGHACTAKTDGTVWCWGSNSKGQLGRTTPAQSLVALQVTGLTSVTDVALASTHSCARIGTTSARCWGANTVGQLGNGTTTDSAASVAVDGLEAVAQLTTYDQHACARLPTGQARCWGRNLNGQLGNGATADSSVPVTVNALWFPPVPLSSVVDVAAGGAHTCAVVGAGVSCWGSNHNRQLGVTGNPGLSLVSVPFP